MPSNWRSKLLGVFILFQLTYLPLANLIKLIPLDLPESTGELNDDIQLRGRAYPAPIQNVADAAGTVFSRWGELTGQAQGWSLFAPVFGHQASLPAVSFLMTEPNDLNTTGSRFLPKDPDVYFRLPETWCRLFNYEYRLTLLYWAWSAESQAAQPEIWRSVALKRVRRQHRSIEAYLAWQERRIPAFAMVTASLHAKLIGPQFPDMGNVEGSMRPRLQSYKPIALMTRINGLAQLKAYDILSRKFVPLEREP